MIILSQRDPRWATIKMGNTNWTLGRIGCTTTCISMLSDYFKCYLNPKEMASALKYTTEGKILWQSAMFSKFRFSARFKGENTQMIDIAIKDPHQAVILELEYSHWVVALRKIGKWYWVADPWTGTKKLNIRSITGGATFISKL